jgi:acyl carrier protein
MQQNIEQTVKEFILREFLPEEDPNQLNDTTPLLSGGILDSIATIKLVVFLEKEFGVDVQPHEATTDNLETIRQIASFIRSKIELSVQSS